MITQAELAFVEDQVRRLIDAEEKLNEASAGYTRAKARFDRHMDRLGYDEADPVGLVRIEAEKANHPELAMWGGRAAWYQQEITARASLVSALADLAWLRGEAEDETAVAQAVRVFDEYVPPVQAAPQDRKAA